MTNSEPIPVEVHQLSRRYGGPQGYEAVRGVSFRVARGELFALLGTNGAGKTSTMELLEGFERPSGGGVRVFGFDPFARRSTVRPRMGIMLQDGGLPSDLTVTETAAMWAATLTSARPVPEALAMVQLEHRAGVRVRQLSGGERRRLDLALALLGRPQLLCLDEPTTGLDPESRRNTWRLVRRLRDEGVTVLLTTHYLEEAEQLADHLAIMHRGRIVATGTTAEVVAAHPAWLSFVLPPSVHPALLPSLTGARTVEAPTGDGLVRVRTDALQQTLTDLLCWARDQRVELNSLDARSATLEEAFLAIAAREEISCTTTEVTP